MINSIIVPNINTVPIRLAYIDPGTGSMLFTVLIGLISAVIYGFRGLVLKLKIRLGKDKNMSIVSDSIPYVIYSDDKRYWTSFKSICEEFEKREVRVSYFTQSEDDPCFDEDYKYVKCEFIGKENKGFAKLNLLKADILLSTTPGLDVYQWKRSKDVRYYVHIPHMPNDITTYRMFGLDYYDAILTSGDYQIEQIRKLETLRGLPNKEIITIGLPYLDELKNKLNNNKVHKDKSLTVLIAPSWGESSVLNKYGSRLIDELLNIKCKIIIRPHPQSYISEKTLINGLMSKYPNSDRIQWNNDANNFECLNKADIMISDFSGVIFDFAFVFNKPVIYADTSFDYSPYDAWWLNEELWTFKVLPELGVKLDDSNLTNISELINICLKDLRFKEGRDKAKRESWANEGKSAKLIVDYLINKRNSIVGNAK